ncbi:MAG: Ger(x)C family spore germination protein [Christensenellales bacterium]|jgi:spore germination protein KC
MKKVSLLLLILFGMLSVQGCSFPEQYPIEDTQNILVAGLDIDGENVVVTALVDTIKSGKPGEEKIEYKLYKTTGKTVFEAKRNFHTYTEKRVAWYHTKYLVIGEQAAKEGLDRLLNYFIEDNQPRMLFRLIIAKGMTANDFLQQSNIQQASLADNIDTLFEESARTGMSREIHIINYVSFQGIPWQSIYIPTIELLPNPDQQKSAGPQQSGPQSSGGQQKSQTMLVKLEGFALFDGDKLACCLDGNSARGLNFVNNDIKSAGISIKDQKGCDVALEIMESKAKIVPSFKDQLSANIDISVKANLVEYQGTIDIFDEKSIKYLEQQLNVFILKEIEQAILTMQEKHTDTIWMGDTFYHNNPIKWQDIKGDWKQLFTDLKITIKVSSNIITTYRLTNAVNQ